MVFKKKKKKKSFIIHSDWGSINVDVKLSILTIVHWIHRITHQYLSLLFFLCVQKVCAKCPWVSIFVCEFLSPWAAYAAKKKKKKLRKLQVGRVFLSHTFSKKIFWTRSDMVVHTYECIQNPSIPPKNSKNYLYPPLKLLKIV